MELIIVAGAFFVLGMYVTTQIKQGFEVNNLEKNLKNYEQKERKKQSQAGTSE